MAQLTPQVANRIAAGSRSVEYRTIQGEGNDSVWACIIRSDPKAEAFSNPARLRNPRDLGDMSWLRVSR